MTYTLYYVSEAHPALGPDHMDQILMVSRRRNFETGLTGLLILHEGRFFQCLEGEGAAVLACYNRITADWRHRRVQLLHGAPADHRAFGNWSMGYAEPDEISPAARDLVRDLSRTFNFGGPGIREQIAAARAVIGFLESFDAEAVD